MLVDTYILVRLFIFHAFFFASFLTDLHKIKQVKMEMKRAEQDSIQALKSRIEVIALFIFSAPMLILLYHIFGGCRNAA